MAYRPFLKNDIRQNGFPDACDDYRDGTSDGISERCRIDLLCRHRLAGIDILRIDHRCRVDHRPFLRPASRQRLCGSSCSRAILSATYITNVFDKFECQKLTKKNFQIRIGCRALKGMINLQIPTYIFPLELFPPPCY